MSIGVDHPDWQQITIWRADPLAAFLNFPLSASNPYQASGWVTNFASLILNIGPAGAGGFGCIVTYYTDDTFATPVSAHSWTVAAGQTLKAILPNVANFVGIEVSTASVAAVDTNVIIQPMNTPVPSIRYNGTGNYVDETALSVPAGSTVNYILPYLAEGPGYFYFRDRTTSGHLSVGLFFFTAAGAPGSRVSYWGEPITTIYQDFVSTSLPLGVSITNDDTAAHTCDFYMTVDGR